MSLYRRPPWYLRTDSHLHEHSRMLFSTLPALILLDLDLFTVPVCQALSPGNSVSATKSKAVTQRPSRAMLGLLSLSRPALSVFLVHPPPCRPARSSFSFLKSDSSTPAQANNS